MTHSTNTRCVPPIRQLTLQTHDGTHSTNARRNSLYKHKTELTLQTQDGTHSTNTRRNSLYKHMTELTLQTHDGTHSTNTRRNSLYKHKTELTLQTQDGTHSTNTRRNSLYKHKTCATHYTTHSTDTRCVPPSAGSIPKISKYRDTCESSIPIFSGIAILRYFWYRTPTIRYLRYLRYSTSSPFDEVDAKAQHRC